MVLVIYSICLLLLRLLGECSSFGLHRRPAQTMCRRPALTFLKQSRDWIDEVRDDELLEPKHDDDDDPPPVKPDMRYIPRNVMKQFQNFVDIRQAGGKELTNDIYVREPQSDAFWFVGKIARVTDVTPAQAISRQWNIIETHAANLRPLELFPSRRENEIWMAPGDSELAVAYNQPDLKFVKMERFVPGADALKSNLVGFQGETYEGGEVGFRTLRNDDGTPANPPVSPPTAPPEELRAPSERELQDIQKMLDGKDINQVYQEQQRRAGIPTDDDD